MNNFGEYYTKQKVIENLKGAFVIIN